MTTSPFFAIGMSGRTGFASCFPIGDFHRADAGAECETEARGHLAAVSRSPITSIAVATWRWDAVADVPSGKSNQSPMERRPIRIGRCRKAFLNAGSAGLLAGLLAGLGLGGQTPSKLLR